MQTRNLSEIKLTNPYLRTETDIESLVKSIEAIGLIHPLTINSNNELLAGGRRFQALKKLNFSEVPVIVAEKSSLEQELISIDENLVRKPLDKLEFEQCLNRGCEIYEQLNPTAKKVDIEKEAITPEEKKQEKEEEENDTTSFAAITSQKLGLSKAVIKQAIKRNAKSSSEIKEARGAGELSAGQVNEIIKLEKNDQPKVLPYIKEKSVKEVRQFVDKVKSSGLNEAIEISLNEKHLPREFSQLNVQVKKCHKMMTKLVIENFDIDHPEMNNILNQVKKLQELTFDFMNAYEDTSAQGENDYSEQELH